MDKMIMYVYGDIITDARVNRAANALSDSYDVTLISTQMGKKVSEGKFRNILIGTHKLGLFHYLSHVYRAYNIIKKHRPDIVYCHDFYSAVLVYVLIKKKFCKKIIYDSHELIIPESGIRDFRLMFFRWFEEKIIRKVDLVISASPERSRLMQDYYDLSTTPLAIRNISQLTVNEDPDTERILLELEDFFSLPQQTVVYAGVLSKDRRIIEVESAVAKSKDKFKLLIVGEGESLSEICEKARKDKILFAYTGKIPYKSLGAVLSKCDIGFVYYPIDILNNKFCASNKIYEYASVSLPMAANPNPTVKKELEENNIGVASNDIGEAILSIGENISSYKKSCLEYTKRNPWKVDESKLLKAIQSTCNK